jgi:hypothetical protein
VTAPVDWGAWRKCPQCAAETGQACLDLSAGGPQAIGPLLCAVPHTRRDRCVPRRRKGREVSGRA